MTYKTYRSPNIGPQPGEASCEDHELVAEVTNSGPKTDNDAWKRNQEKLRDAANKASLNAYPPKQP